MLSYRVHGLLCLQSLGMFDSLHFLLVFPQHPKNMYNVNSVTLINTIIMSRVQNVRQFNVNTMSQKQLQS